MVVVACALPPQTQPASSIWHVSVLWDESLQPTTLVPWQDTTGPEKVLVHTDGQFCQIRMHAPKFTNDTVAQEVLGGGLYLCLHGARGKPLTSDEQGEAHTFVWKANWSRGVMADNSYEVVIGTSIVGYKSVTTTSQYPTGLDDFASLQVLGHEIWHYLKPNFHPRNRPKHG